MGLRGLGPEFSNAQIGDADKAGTDALGARGKRGGGGGGGSSYLDSYLVCHLWSPYWGCECWAQILQMQKMG